MDVRPASVEDAAAILGLRTEAETWLAERGIEQWHPGEISLADVQGQVAAGEWHVACDAGRVRTALRLLWSDPVWGDDQPAVYVHGLVIDHAQAGRGLGARLLDWAAARGRRAAATVLRLERDIAR